MSHSFFVTFTNVENKEIYAEFPNKIRGGVHDKNRDILNPSGIIIEHENLENEIYNLFVPIWNHFGYANDYK